MVNNFYFNKFWLYLVLFIFCFSIKNTFAIEISINNDQRPGEEGSILEVEEAQSWESPRAKLKFRVRPGETKPITAGNLKSMIVSSVFATSKKKYLITCEENSKEEKATLTILKIYNQELPSACIVESVGHWSKKSGTKWDKVIKTKEN